MANNADGTDGSGSPRLGGNTISGKEGGTYGHTASRSMPDGKTVSGKETGEYGTRTGSSNSHVPQNIEKDGGPISKHGGW